MPPIQLQVQHHFTGVLRPFREELVKIAFEECVRNYRLDSASQVAIRTNALAKAMLAEMEKEPEAENDDAH